MPNSNRKLIPSPSLYAFRGINEKKIMKRGEIIVKKKDLIEHCNTIFYALQRLDAVMKEKDSFKRGQEIARIANGINLSLDQLKHFSLNIPLDKLNRPIK